VSQTDWNLLTAPLLRSLPGGWVTLPGMLACLARDEVDSFPALRPHQAPSWHMFLVQLAALGLHRAGIDALPTTESEWVKVLRGLTLEFPGDEPWRLVVEDPSKPAFMQSPIPHEAEVQEPIATPDALDLLTTARNHDLKRGIARIASSDDWIFALVCLQTMAPSGGGQGGYRQIARIKGGWSFRPFAALEPLDPLKPCSYASFGAAFRRNVRVLLSTRESLLLSDEIHKKNGGIALLWTCQWEEGSPLQLQELDLWFIEVSRRIRLSFEGGKIVAAKGTARGPRVAAEQFNGSIGDPWAPVHRTKNEMFSLGSRGFDYKLIVDLFISREDWIVPVLAEHSDIDDENGMFALVLHAFSHDKKGNSRGLRSRVLPIGGRTARVLRLGPKRDALHELACEQVREIETYHEALRHSLALFAGSGDQEKCDKDKREKKKFYPRASAAKTSFDRAADEVFFEHLWARFEAQDEGPERLKFEAEQFARVLYQRANVVFEDALPAIPCPSLYRPRAEARARSKFQSIVRFAFPELFPSPVTQENNDAVAR